MKQRREVDMEMANLDAENGKTSAELRLKLEAKEEDEGIGRVDHIWELCERKRWREKKVRRLLEEESKMESVARERLQKISEAIGQLYGTESERHAENLIEAARGAPLQELGRYIQWEREMFGIESGSGVVLNVWGVERYEIVGGELRNEWAAMDKWDERRGLKANVNRIAEIITKAFGSQVAKEFKTRLDRMQNYVDTEHVRTLVREMAEKREGLEELAAVAMEGDTNGGGLDDVD